MIKKLLHQYRDPILRRWHRLAVESYAPDARPYLARDGNPFANPVGAAIADGLAELLTYLAADERSEQLPERAIGLIKVRAVQEFGPARALAFIPGLKPIVREVLAGELSSAPLAEWVELEGRIDALTLQCFDAYVRARERLLEVRVNEARHRSSILLARAGVTEPEFRCPSALLDAGEREPGPAGTRKRGGR
jgi:hypothetical protein